MVYTPRIQFTPTQRRAILLKHPTCNVCRKNPSTIADHCKPVAEGGPTTLDNGQGLCSDCHDAKTQTEILRGVQRYNFKRYLKSEDHPGLVA